MGGGDEGLGCVWGGQLAALSARSDSGLRWGNSEAAAGHEKEAR